MTDTSWIDEIEALLAASTPEPWEASVWERNVFVGGGPNNDDIAEFNFADEHTVKITKEQAIAHAKLFAAAPAIVRALRASLAREKAMREALAGLMQMWDDDQLHPANPTTIDVTPIVRARAALESTP